MSLKSRIKKLESKLGPPGVGYPFSQKGEMLNALDSFQQARLLEQTALTLVGDGYAQARAGLKEKALGERDQAFGWLEKACDDHSSWLIFLGVDPRFDPVRADPRFKEIMRRIGLAADQRR
jgi:hypothetical protein